LVLPLIDREVSAEIIELCRSGARDAFRVLYDFYKDRVYSVSLYFFHGDEAVAADVTQQVFLKLLTTIHQFKGDSAFSTWLYRMVVNHVLNMKRGRADMAGWTFARYADSLDATPDMDLPDPSSVPADVKLLVDEARIGCTSGMLLCLDRQQRLIYILGEIFGVTDVVGAEILEISRENFRQKLARARRDLHNFMQDKCGLINEANPCRCAKKTQGFMKAGYVDPRNLLFARAHVTRVRDVAEKKSHDLDVLDEAYAEIHRDHPFQEPVSSLRALIDRTDFKTMLELD